VSTVGGPGAGDGGGDVGAASDAGSDANLDEEGPSTLLGGGDSLGDGVVTEGGFDLGDVDTSQFDTEGSLEP
jgi:hypothetical protein